MQTCCSGCDVMLKSCEMKRDKERPFSPILRRWRQWSLHNYTALWGRQVHSHKVCVNSLNILRWWCGVAISINGYARCRLRFWIVAAKDCLLDILGDYLDAPLTNVDTVEEISPTLFKTTTFEDIKTFSFFLKAPERNPCVDPGSFINFHCTTRFLLYPQL